MKNLIISLFVILLFSSAPAQVEWFGYYESEGDFVKVPAKYYYFGYNKLRMDFETNPGDQIHIAGDVVHRFYNGTTRINFMDFLHTSLHPVLPMLDNAGNVLTDSLGNPVMYRLDTFEFAFPDTTFIDNIFLEIHFGHADLTLGRQQISPGVGYAWNPTDIFNIKDLFDPTYEQTGVSAIRLEIPANRWILTGIISPAQDWSESIQYYQLKGGLNRWDASLVYSRSIYEETGLSGAATYQRDLYGLNLEGELWGLGLHAEIAVNRLKNSNGKKMRNEYVAGLDYTTESSLYTLVEYYHNDMGKPAAKTTFDDYLTYFMGERKSINRDYIFATGMYPFTDLLTGGYLLIANLTDKSFTVNPQFTYSIMENVEMNILLSFFHGDRADEFGYQQIGGRLRLRAYF